jgi:hypothetical protein
MTDEHELDPELDPEQEERVRALLADLGTAPDAAAMPPEVAARLDETLASLVAEQSPADPAVDAGGAVVPLRRRWAPRLAAATAAVIVVGVGGVAVANLGGFGGSSAKDTSSAGSAAGGNASSGAESLDSSAPAAPSGTPSALSGSLAARLPRVTAGTFEADVTRMLQRRPEPQRTSASERKAAQDGTDTASGKALIGSCTGPSTDSGETTEPVLYDGALSVLVIGPAEGGQRTVTAYSCDGRTLRSAHVPDPGVASASPTP